MHPVSAGQRGIWISEQLYPRSSTYVDGVAYEVSGTLKTEILAESVRLLTARHSALRTRFDVIRGEPVQVIDEQWSGHVRVIHADEEADRHAETREFVSDEFDRPFDFTLEPPFRVGILRLSATEHIVVITVHHIVSDGQSLQIILGDLSRLYNHLSAGTRPQLPPVGVQYLDYVRWQIASQKPRMAKASEFWRSYLDGARFTVDRLVPGLPQREAKSAAFEFTLPESLVEQLVATSRAHDTMLFTTLLAGFETVIARLSGIQDFLVGVPVGGRDMEQLQAVVGYFVNLLPIRADLRGVSTVTELLTRTHKSLFAGLASPHIPFSQLVEMLNPNRPLGAPPLTQASIQLFDISPAGRLHLDGLAAVPIQDIDRAMASSLHLNVFRSAKALRCALYYEVHLFTLDECRQLVDMLIEAFTEFSRRPAGDLSALTLRTTIV